MDKLSHFLRKNALYVEIGLILFLIVFGIPYFIVDHVHLEIGIGDPDSMNDFFPLDSFSRGFIPYKDFLWNYGPTYFFLYYLGFLSFGKTLYAMWLTKWILFNGLTIFVTYLSSRILFSSRFIRVFFVAAGILAINSNMVSLRHIFPEFAILFFLYSCEKESKILAIFSGIIFALSIGAGIEYGIAGTLGFILSSLVTFFLIKRNRINIYILFILGFLLPVLSLIIYLYRVDALRDFYLLHKVMLTNYGVTNPARGEFFPGFFLYDTSSLKNFLTSFVKYFFSKELRVYIPLVVYFTTFIFIIKKIINRDFFSFKLQVSLVMIFYGVAIYYRTLTGPAYGFFTYGLFPAIVLGFFYIEYVYNNTIQAYKIKNIIELKKNLVILIVIIIWIIFSNEFFPMKNMYEQGNVSLKNQTVYNAKIGYKISSEANDQYVSITDYIQKNSKPSDSIFVYPHGIFAFLANRPQVKLYAMFYAEFLGGDIWKRKVLEVIENEPPKFVVLNKLNGGMKIGASRSDIPEYTSWGTEDSPCFYGEPDVFQYYILENYELEKDFKYASVLKRRQEKKIFPRITKKLISKVDLQVSKFFINGKPEKYSGKIAITSQLMKIDIEPDPLERSFSMIKVNYSIENNLNFLQKYFTKSSLFFYGNFENQQHLVTQFEDLVTFNTVRETLLKKVYFREDVSKFKSITIQINTPSPYFLPSYFVIHSIEFYEDEKVEK